MAKRRVACSMAPAFTVSKMRETQKWNSPDSRQPKGSPNARSPMMSKVVKLSQLTILKASFLEERRFICVMNWETYIWIMSSCSTNAFWENEWARALR